MDEHEDEDSDILYIAHDDASDLYVSLVSTAFLHGVNIPMKMEAALTVQTSQLQRGLRLPFDGIRLDTAANRR